MAASLNILFATVMLSLLVVKGYCQCHTSDISVGQTVTGRLIRGKPEYQVSVKNNCECDQRDVILNAEGFDSVKAVYPLIFGKIIGDEGHGIVKNGGIIHNLESVDFSYAWDTSFDLSVASSTVICHG